MIPGSWDIELEDKPDFEKAMQRIYAWYNQEMIDRPPIRFSAHNAEYVISPHLKKSWPTLKDRWLDAEYQVDSFIDSIRAGNSMQKHFLYSGLISDLRSIRPFMEANCNIWKLHLIRFHLFKTPEDINRIRFDKHNHYFMKIEELTRLALEKCKGRFMVGYTDLHPGNGLRCSVDRSAGTLY